MFPGESIGVVVPGVFDSFQFHVICVFLWRRFFIGGGAEGIDVVILGFEVTDVVIVTKRC